MSFDAFSMPGHDKHEQMETEILNDLQQSFKLCFDIFQGRNTETNQIQKIF